MEGEGRRGGGESGGGEGRSGAGEEYLLFLSNSKFEQKTLEFHFHTAQDFRSRSLVDSFQK